MLQNLIRFLPLAEKVISRRTTLPILTHVCIRDGYVSATDLDNTVRMKVDDNRDYMIPLNIIKTVLKAKPKRLEIDILENEKVQIKYDQKKLTFRSLDPEEFPGIPTGKYKSLGTWTPGIIRKLYSQLPYTSSDELKPALNGVFFDQNGVVKSCATNGHILRVINNTNSEGKAKLKNTYQGVIPKKALQILARSVKRDVLTAATNTHLRIKIDKDTEFFVRLIGEKYPDYDLVIPKEFNGNVSLDKSLFEGLIQDAKPFVNRETKQGVFTVGKSSMEVEVEDREKDIHWDSTLSVTVRDGEDIKMGLNVHLLEQVLKGIDEKEVLWQYTTPVSANILTGINGTQPNTLHLLMPIRLKEDCDE